MTDRRRVSWVEFCRWVQGRTITRPQPHDFTDAEQGLVEIAFDDGATAVVRGESDFGPPSVHVDGPTPGDLDRHHCDCLAWQPGHEPDPRCTWPGCDDPATHMLLHVEVGERCRHLVCPRHAAEPRSLAEHRARPLADLYPGRFPPAPTTVPDGTPTPPR